MEKKTSIVISAIAGLVLLECLAILKGLDGQLFFFIGVVIAGLAGLSIPTPKILKGSETAK